MRQGIWNKDECYKFITLIHRNGKKWSVIKNEINGRSAIQCRTYGQKYLEVYNFCIWIGWRQTLYEKCTYDSIRCVTLLLMFSLWFNYSMITTTIKRSIRAMTNSIQLFSTRKWRNLLLIIMIVRSCIPLNTSNHRKCLGSWKG